MRKISSILILLMFFTIGCKNDAKLIGKWEGIKTQKTWLGNEYQSKHEIEFADNGLGWEINYNDESNEPYSTRIFTYEIINDTIYFKDKKNKNWNVGIELITQNKLIYKKPKENGTEITYELNKFN